MGAREHENFNGLLRQYLPKGSCMRLVTQAQCDHIADDLNNRPRKRLAFRTPAQLLQHRTKACCTCSLNLRVNVEFAALFIVLALGLYCVHGKL